MFRPLAYRDGLRLIELMDGALKLVDLSPRAAVPAAEELVTRFRRPLPNVASHLYAVVPVKAMKERLKHLAKMRVARVGLALLELRQETGEWPRALDRVIPLVGAEEVIDPYTGNQLDYEPGVRLEAMDPLPGGMERDSEEFKEIGDLYQIVWRFGPRR